MRSRTVLIVIVFALTCIGVGGRPQKSERQSAQEQTQIRKLDDDGMREFVGLTGKRTRPLMAFLWYSACQACTQRLSEIDKLYLEFKDKGIDVAIIAIEPMDNDKKLPIFLAEHRIQTPAYLLNSFEDDLSDDVFLKNWETIVPAVFLYDKKGKVVFYETEEKQIEQANLRKHLMAMIRSTEAQ